MGVVSECCCKELGIYRIAGIFRGGLIFAVFAVN